ncbi:hypothetical protein [Zobellia uliginosa]|uniref:hypothetical protein n=1 Tax=Zobellia uliginosa TaxID=143224 RepID=UPI0026E3DB0D|nr:hypothetical protein [Zobellia uliginosa]MDO6518141.1 hypothetical protein [Zobellia uliginosa]
MKRTVLLLALVFIMASCKNHPLAIEVLNSKTIKDFPSGSGIVAVENGFYALATTHPSCSISTPKTRSFPKRRSMRPKS